MPLRSELLRAALIGGALLLLSPAYAADRQTTERLAGIDADLGGLSRQAATAKANFTTRSELVGVSDARRRYEDALYAYLVGDWEGAASSFYILVQSRAQSNEALARDSEFYLAESIYELGHYRSALEAWQAIIDRPGHPYAPDAVRRSLEVFGILGDNARFDSFYNKYIVSGKVPATDAVNYTLAKSFYRRGERARAKSLFEALPATSSWYSRAHHFLGVMMLAEKNLPQAAAEFQKAAAAPTVDDGQKEVAQEAALALARVYYEQGNFKEATTWYEKIPADSKRYGEALYESIWTHIKQSQWEDARREAQAYLAANPEDEHTESLQLLIGHLHLKTGTWDNALSAYAQVSENYGSVSGRLDEIARDPAQVRLFLDRIQAGEGTAGVPGFAMDMLLEDERTRRATEAWIAVGDQKRELADCNQMIVEIRKVLAIPDRELSSFATARLQIDGMRTLVIRIYNRLIEAEAGWLKPLVSVDQRNEINAILAERDNLAIEIFAANGGQGESRRINAETRYTELRTRLIGMRGSASDAATTGKQIDEMWTRASRVDADAAAARQLVDAGSRQELETVRSKLATTEQRVAALDKEVAAATVKTSDTAVRVIGDGLMELRDAVAADVLAADKGIVDVYWIQKTNANAETERFAEDQAAELQALDERYRRIRQNLGD